MLALLTALIIALGPTPAAEGPAPEVAPVRVSVALLPAPVVANGELVTVEATVMVPPPGQPGADVTVDYVDLFLPDGRVLSMDPTAADPRVWDQHLFADARLGPGLHTLEVVAVDTEGREHAVAVTLEIVPAALDVAAGP